MPSRELKSPIVTVSRDESGDDPLIRIRFAAPGSTFGPVEVVLYEYEAEALVTDIEEHLNG